MRKVIFAEDHIYHICNRGVEGRTLFLDTGDYFRLIHDLYEFNDEEPATFLYFKRPFLQSYETKSHRIEKQRKCIVEILAFALLPNHYHLLLRQLKNKGISEFMHKLGVGYAMYFNQKYRRAGRLFQGPFRAVRVEHESHFIHLPFYIHANPLDLIFPGWREGGLKNISSALQFLEHYRWSSFPDYIGKKNFPSVIHQKFLADILGKPKQYKATTKNLLKNFRLEDISRTIALEDVERVQPPL